MGTGTPSARTCMDSLIPTRRLTLPTAARPKCVGGGDAASTYNWQLETYNSAADYYFEDFAATGFNNGSDGSSTQFITDVKNAGGTPLMTMVMLPWVAQSPETSVTQGGTDNYHWSYSVASFGAQCSVDPYNTDAGDGLETDCSTPVTTNATTTAYYPLLDDSSQTCPGTTCVYRNTWAAALATAFGSAPHFYDMDNEIEIWVARTGMCIRSLRVMTNCATRLLPRAAR